MPCRSSESENTLEANHRRVRECACAANQEVAMKYLRKAAIAAVASFATLVGSSSLFANTDGWVVATSFNNQTSIITGITKLWEIEVLKYGIFTQNQFIDNPDLIPPGICRKVAIFWDVGVFLNRPQTYFNKLLRTSAQHNCNLAFTRLDAANADGSFNLTKVAPSK
jgi:hypothetical protein